MAARRLSSTPRAPCPSYLARVRARTSSASPVYVAPSRSEEYWGVQARRPQKVRSVTPDSSVTRTGVPSSPFVAGYPRASGKSSRGRRSEEGTGAVDDVLGVAEGGVGPVSSAKGADVAVPHPVSRAATRT